MKNIGIALLLVLFVCASSLPAQTATEKKKTTCSMDKDMKDCAKDCPKSDKKCADGKDCKCKKGARMHHAIPQKKKDK